MPRIFRFAAARICGYSLRDRSTGSVRRRDGGPQGEQGMRHGGKILVDQLEARRHRGVHGAGRELPRRARRPARLQPHQDRHLPPGRRRLDDGGGLGQDHRRARHLLRHARPRRRQRHERAARRAAGLHADGAVRRPAGAASTRTARRSRRSRSKQLFSSFVKWAAVIRQTERIPEYVSRAFHVGALGPARARSCSDCRRTCCRPTARRSTPSRARHRRARSPAPPTCELLQAELGKAAAPADDRRRARLEHATCRRRSRPSPSASICRSRRRSATRTTSTTGTAATSAAPASASTRRWPPPSRRPTC